MIDHDESERSFRVRAIGMLAVSLTAFICMVVHQRRAPVLHPPSQRSVFHSSLVVEPRVFGARDLEVYLQEAAEREGVPVALLRAVARVESNFNPRARSSVGAMGVMQLMPKTAAAMGVQDAYDARANILGGARYLRLLSERWHNDLVLTIASYNAGPGAVQRHRGIPPYAETQRYVRRVLHHYDAYRGRGGSGAPVGIADAERSTGVAPLSLPGESTPRLETQTQRTPSAARSDSSRRSRTASGGVMSVVAHLGSACALGQRDCRRAAPGGPWRVEWRVGAAAEFVASHLGCARNVRRSGA